MICKRCGRNNINYMRSSLYCDECLDYILENQKQRHRRLYKQGLCRCCGKRKIDTSRSSVLCGVCLDRYSAVPSKLYKRVIKQDLVDLSNKLKEFAGKRNK